MTEQAFGALSMAQRRTYRDLQSGIEAFRTEFVYLNETNEGICGVFKAVLADHPEYFWLTGSSKGTVETLGSSVKVYFRPEFVGSSSALQLRSEKSAFDAKVSELIALAKRRSNVLYEQIVFLHDHMVRHTDYRMNVSHCFDAYGCLVLGKAVCAGYAAAFQVLMNRLGVECGRLHGSSSSQLTGETSHEWNYIRLQDGYYFIDVTWDDPAVAGGSTGDNLSHVFFGLNLRELQLTHRISPGQNVPSAYGTRFDYFRYYGRCLERYSFEAVRAVAQRQLAQDGRFFVKFGSKAQADAAVRDLIDGRRVYSIPGISGRISYGVSKSGLVLEVRRKKPE